MKSNLFSVDDDPAAQLTSTNLVMKPFISTVPKIELFNVGARTSHWEPPESVKVKRSIILNNNAKQVTEPFTLARSLTERNKEIKYWTPPLLTNCSLQSSVDF